MPISFTVDHHQKRITICATGVIIEEDIRQFVEAVKAQNCRGFDEIADLSDVEKIDYQSSAQVMNIVSHAATLDTKDRRAKFAFVVSNDTEFGLSRIYQSYRESAPGANREIRVFRSRNDALTWLDGE